MDSNEELELLLELTKLGRRLVEIELRLQGISEVFGTKETVTFAISDRARVRARALSPLIDVSRQLPQPEQPARAEQRGRRSLREGRMSTNRRRR